MVDAGVIFGAGFAPFRGGALHYVEESGRDIIVDRLKELGNKYGDRFMADAGAIFA